MDTIEIPRTEYAELQAAKAKADRVDDAEGKLKTAEDEKADLQTKLDAAEVAKKAAEDEKADLKKKVDDFEEKANQETLGSERFGKLGSKFKKALPEEVATRLKGDAGKLSDDDWKGRLDELAALVKVKADENLDGSEKESEGDPEFSREEAALGGAGGDQPSGGTTTSTAARRRSVVASL